MRKSIAQLSTGIGIILASGAAIADNPLCVIVDQTYGVSDIGQCVAPSGSGVGASKRRDNQLYAGLSWSFDKKPSKMPDFVVGLRSVTVSSSDKVQGADFSLRLRYAGDISADSIRLSYVGGKRDMLANIGVGYSMSEKSPLLTGAIQGSYLRVGTDFAVGVNKFSPYMDAISLKAPKAVATSQSSCSSGTLATVVSNSDSYQQGVYGLYSDTLENGGLAVGTQTCFVAAPG